MKTKEKNWNWFFWYERSPCLKVGTSPERSWQKIPGFHDGFDADADLYITEWLFKFRVQNESLPPRTLIRESTVCQVYLRPVVAGMSAKACFATGSVWRTRLTGSYTLLFE
jgi:hypothetical protein